MTECGHNYCEPCIRECLNRRHRCPLCNTETIAEKLVRNHQHDCLLERVLDEKQKATRRYVENVAAGAGAAAAGAAAAGSGGGGGGATLIERVFHKHAGTTLVEFTQLQHTLEAKFERQRREVRAMFQSQIDELAARVRASGGAERVRQAAGVADGASWESSLLVELLILTLQHTI